MKLQYAPIWMNVVLKTTRSRPFLSKTFLLLLHHAQPPYFSFLFWSQPNSSSVPYYRMILNSQGHDFKFWHLQSLSLSSFSKGWRDETDVPSHKFILLLMSYAGMVVLKLLTGVEGNVQNQSLHFLPFWEFKNLYSHHQNFKRKHS